MKNNKKEKGNFPILRFKEFQGEWEIVKLKNIVQKVSEKNKENKIDIVFSNSATKGIVLQTEYFDKNIANKDNLCGYYIVIPNDFVYNPRISSNAEVGAMSVNHTELTGLVSPLYTVFRIINVDIDTLFLEYIFKSKVWHNYMRSIASYGARDDRMNVKDVAFFDLPLCMPLIREQRKIASLLFLIDERIQAQSKIIEDLRLLKSVLLKKAFFQELRFPQFNENWKTIRLGDIGTFFSGGTPLTSMEWYYNGDIPFIKSGEINADCTEQFISEEGLKNSSAKMIEIGDLIYALYGATSGEVGISKIKGAINQAVLCIRTKLNSIFLLNYLMFKKAEILRTYLQGGQGNLSAEIIKSLRIPVPINAEQTKLAYLFSAFDKKVELEMNIMAKLKQQKQYLLQQMFI